MKESIYNYTRGEAATEVAEERERREEEEGGGKGGREEDDVTLWRDTERLDTSAITPMHTYQKTRFHIHVYMEIYVCIAH